MQQLAMCLVVLILASLPRMVAAQPFDLESDQKRVVLLNSTDPHLPAFLAVSAGLQAAVLEESVVSVEFYDETLDVQRFGQARLEEQLLSLLKTKYQDLKVDVVVAISAVALSFAQRHGEELWPGAAIVFNSVSSDSLAAVESAPGTAGVPVDLDFARTIELALRLRPKTRRIAVVAGIAEADKRLLSEVRASLEGHPYPIDVDYLAGLPLDATLAAVQALPADAVILYTTVFRDGSGRPHVPLEVLKQVASVAPVPIFGVFESYLGNGITAGVIASYDGQGRRTGEIVARILGGEDASAIGIDAPFAGSCMADWRQLDLWGIGERLLPRDCDVRFREETVWDHHHREILAGLAIILLQLALIVMLVLNRRRLRLAQANALSENALRSEVEKRAGMLQRRLTRSSRERSLGAMVTTLAHEINQPLIAIQNYAQAAKRRLQGIAGDEPKIIELLAKIEGQAERAGAITQRVRSLVNNSEAQMSPVSLNTLIEEVISMLKPECEALGCRIDYLRANGPVTVLADTLQIQLVLVNLLNNALHSLSAANRTDGVIAIDAERLDPGEVRISVTDEGGGISRDREQYIFEPLYSEKSTGMGMGLAICRDIIDLHGGRIWYEPNPAGGAVFRFTLRTSES